MIIFLIKLCGIMFLLILTIGWIIHIQMVLGDGITYGWGSFRQFIREFVKYEWDNENWGGHDLFNRKSQGYIHAGIVKFNNIGMIMRTPIDYLLMHLFLGNQVRKLKRKNKISWSDSKKVNWNKPIMANKETNFDWNKLDCMIDEWEKWRKNNIETEL